MLSTRSAHALSSAPATSNDATPAAENAVASAECDLPIVEPAVEALEKAFGQPFFVLDTSTDTVHRSGSGCLNFNIHSRLGVCDQVARRGRPEVIEDFSPLLSIAAPLIVDDEPSPLVAVSTFVTEPICDEQQTAPAAQAFGVEASQTFRWARRQEVWNPRAVVQLTKSLANNAKQAAKIAVQKTQLKDVSAHLLSTFEELSMLHRLSERLSIASSDVELSEMAIQWLADVVPAECFAAVHCPDPNAAPAAPDEGPQAEALTFGPCPIEEHEFGQFIERLGPDASRSCLVLNQEATQSPTWYYPEVRELISVPIRSGERVLGWVIAFNHTGGGCREREFGSVEASLVSSVAAILGVHAGNYRLYREQKEFFAAMVRALSSAIDAKDPYTSGHSDRVARMAVCLARKLGRNSEELNTIYLAGLLHDIGKIGIDDHVLRKSGKLTEVEFEHIKTHPELGHRILEGIKQLSPVLPIVLHHHEAWNGKGYPSGLAGEECPVLARIVAVADSIDAMSSDRPYRRGMDDDQLDQILRDGAGKQWDAEVVDAVFAVRDQLREIGATDRAPLALDVREWHT